MIIVINFFAVGQQPDVVGKLNQQQMQQLLQQAIRPEMHNNKNIQQLQQQRQQQFFLQQQQQLLLQQQQQQFVNDEAFKLQQPQQISPNKLIPFQQQAGQQQFNKPYVANPVRLLSIYLLIQGNLHSHT